MILLVLAGLWWVEMPETVQSGVINEREVSLICIDFVYQVDVKEEED